jgi:hypothetical protein
MSSIEPIPPSSIKEPIEMDRKTARAERREEVKLVLEYAKLAISLAGLGTLLFAALQWAAANRAADQANRIADRSMYEKISNEWREHTQTFVRQPHLWPYFESGKELRDDDPNRDLVLALANVRLDAMDAILTYFAIQPPAGGAQGWKNTFARAFRTSPPMCARLRATEASWANAQILPIWRANCQSSR